MNKIKNIVLSFPIFCAAALLALICIIVTALNGLALLAFAEFVVLAVVVALIFLYYGTLNMKKQKMLNQISSNLDFLGGTASKTFPLPVVVCSSDGEIIWYSTRFEENVAGFHSAAYSELASTFKEMGMDAVIDSLSGLTVECDGKFFNLYSHHAKKDNENVVVIYFVDVTKYRLVADEFMRTRPAVVIMTIDNMSEIQQDYRESDCAAIRNGIEKLIEEWLADYPCFISKVSDSKFYIVAEKQDIDSMIDRRFGILDTVRAFTYDGKFVGATLSIGVGNGSELTECEKNAKLSIDMALGRGGDQAVIKSKDDYEFFGGVSKSVESSNKVKTRIVASALSELIQGCENVYIMGHRFPDFDAIGAAFGVAFVAKSLGKNSYIVTDAEKSMAKPLIERAKTDGMFDMIMSVEQAKQTMTSGKKDLLIVVDTHISNFVESPELLSKSEMIVVIDHHRKAVDYIDNAVIFFHDPSASSTSEMVAELVEYTPEAGELDSLTADALMSGIMLDTKNFVLRTTPRTFEAAAFLKSQNSDTVRVKKLFANDIESHHARNTIINGARKYRNCAIAVADDEIENIRMISAQAADELLNISGVDASFVVFNLDGNVCVSARSLGAVNVQVLMEQLGGGGHQTMAATQVKNSNVKTVTADVMRSIDSYNEKKEV